MLTVTLSQKIKACRAILGLTQSEVSREASLSEVSVIQIESGLNMTKARILTAFYARKGLFITDTGITTVKEEFSDAYSALTHDDIVRELYGDEAFEAHHRGWDATTRQSFCQTVSAFAEQGFDIWFVNLDGQIRIGYKDPDGQRGKPFAFLTMEKDGFFLLWHDKLDASFFAFSNNKAYMTPEKAKALPSFLSAHYGLIPPALRELSAGRMPSDYK